MAGSYLQNHVTNTLALQKRAWHTAFSAAHAHRHATFFIKIGCGQRNRFPGPGRKRANAHIAENQRIYPAHRRDRPLNQQIFTNGFQGQVDRFQDPSQWRTEVEGVAFGIQGRIGHLAYAAYNNAVQRPFMSRLSAAAFDSIWPPCNDLPAAFGISHWPDSVRGTDLLAHSAANTGFRDTLRLPNYKPLTIFLPPCRNACAF